MMNHPAWLLAEPYLNDMLWVTLYHVLSKPTRKYLLVNESEWSSALVVKLMLTFASQQYICNLTVVGMHILELAVFSGNDMYTLSSHAL